MAGDVYKAVADPTRRAMLDLLAERERPVEDLVARRAEGRHRLYRTVADPLHEVYAWAGGHLRRQAAEEPRARILRLAAQYRERNPHRGALRALRPAG